MEIDQRDPLDDIPDEIKKALFKVRVVLNNKKIVERNCMADVTLNYDMLEEQLIENPSIFAYFSMLLAEQKSNVAAIERKIASRKGRIRDNIIGQFENKEYNLRQGDIKELIDADEKVMQNEAELILANKTLSKLYGVVDTLRMKNDNLRSLGGFKKIERDT